MTLDELEQLARNASWTSRLGSGPVAGAVHIVSRGQWDALIAECLVDEFDLSEEPAEDSHVPEFRWLSEDIECDLPPSTMRQSIARVVFEATTHLSSPWLEVGNVDFTTAFRRAAVHTFTCAAAEIQAGTPRIWTEAARLYAEGRWPFGVTDEGALVVL